MLIDHVRNLPLSQEPVVFLSTLLIDTYSFPEVRMLVELLFSMQTQTSRQAYRSREIGSPAIDRDVISSSIDYAI